MWCRLNKYKVNDSTQVIYQSIIPPTLSETATQKLSDIANKIAKAYEVDNSPLLIQAMINGNDVKVIEFSARLGGGAKYKTIQNVTGFNVLRANLESMLGEKPKVEIKDDGRCYSRCHIYVKGGLFSAIEGLDELQKKGIIEEYVLTKPFGVEIGSPKSSSDRVASVFISASSKEELGNKIIEAISNIKVLDENGSDMFFREMYSSNAL
jgi:phosphoribosylamine-glycine ligase